jgi:phosphate:Na+ symporter
MMLLADATLNDLDWFKIIVNLAGGLAIFLFGMTVMTDGLKSATGDGLRKMLAKLTSNRIMGTGCGVVLTGLTQSSSVTTVLLVGFVSAGLMSMHQSIGVILGSNIGSTFTAQIIAFDVDRYVPMLIAIGFFTQMLSRRVRLRSAGTMLLGLGLVFAGMSFMSEATSPLRGHPTFIRLMGEMDNPLWGVLIGAAVTVVIQSSAATTAMVIVLAGQGAITLEAGIALAFGANIGTCFTALVAALGKPRVALQVAVAHTLFNVVGVLIWVAFIPQFAEWVRMISPTSPGLEGAAQLAAEAPRQIANAHTLFNVVNALLVLPLITPMAWLVSKLVRDRPRVEAPVAVPKYLDEDALTTPSLALDYARLELARLGKRVARMCRVTPSLAGEHADRASSTLTKNRAEVDALYDQILNYLVRVSRKELPRDLAERSEALLAIASHFGGLAEIIEDDLASAVAGMKRTGLVASDPTKELIWSLHEVTQQALDMTIEALQSCDADLADQVVQMKADVYGQAEALNHHLAQRLAAEEPDRARLYRTESELRGQIKRVYYVARRIAKHIQALV